MTDSMEDKCSICKKDILPDPTGWAGGHNADPVNKGRCCGKCNDKVVLPARLQEWTERRKGD